MRIYQSILTYLLIFLTLSLLMKLFGIISFPGSEIISYCLILFGGGAVFASLGRDQKVSLFLGTIIFLSGVLLYVLNNFLVFYHSSLILPSVFLIGGSAFLMLFIDSVQRKKSLVTAIVLITAGLILFYRDKGFSNASFIDAFFNVMSNYWTVIIISLLIFLLIWWEER